MIDKELDLSVLPRKIYKNRECIDWDKSIGYKLKFKYKEISGYIVILGCEDRMLHIKYSIYGLEKHINASNFMEFKFKDIYDKIHGISKVNKYIKICKKKGYAISKKELYYRRMDSKSFNSALKYLGYSNIKDVQIKNDIPPRKISRHSYFDLYTTYNRFYKEYGRFPVHTDFKNNKWMTPKQSCIKIMEELNITYDDLFKKIAKTNLTIEEYEYKNTVDKFVDWCNKNNRVMDSNKMSELIGHDIRWIMYRNKNIKNYNDFYRSLGFKKEEDLSKEEVIDIINNMQSKLDRPLMYDDFRAPNYDEVGITTVKRYWGTMNKMKKDLGLEIIQDDMVCKHIEDINVYINDLHNICDTVFSKFNRNNITCDDINNYTELNLKSSSISKNIKKISNMTLRGIIESYKDFSFQKEGYGTVNYLDDGEITKSKYEYIFSNKLREFGYKYNIDYKRDIKYRSFINEYNGLLDCDYIIKINNRIVYIEIAGMLVDRESNYINNIPINETTNRREKYRLKLIKKEQMLKDNNLEYYIILPSYMKDMDKLFEKLKINNKCL